MNKTPQAGGLELLPVVVKKKITFSKEASAFLELLHRKVIQPQKRMVIY